MAYQNYTHDELNDMCETILELVSRFKKYLDKLSSEPTITERIEVQLRMDRIRPLYEKFDEVASLLEKASNLDFSRAEFEDSYFKSLAKAEKLSASGFKIHEMMDYEILNNRRKCYQVRIADFSAYVRDNVMNKTLSSSDILELKMSIERVEPMYKQYEEAQLKLESVGLIPAPHFMTATFEFEAEFHAYLAKSKDLLCKLENSNPSTT